MSVLADPEELAEPRAAPTYALDAIFPSAKEGYLQAAIAFFSAVASWIPAASVASWHPG